MGIPKKTVSILLPPELHAELQGLAQENCRSLSAYIRQVLKQHIQTLEGRQSQETL